MLISAIVLISGALVAYTAGVLLEHRRGVLRRGHAALFALGLTLDASGTAVMGAIARSGSTNGSADGTAALLTSVMAVTGAAALLLMALHLIWATVVLTRRRPSEMATFHRLSLAVWAVWLVPYLTGMLGSML